MLAVLDFTAVTELLSYADCISVMREALSAVADGQVHQPLRTVVQPPTDGVMALMPAYLKGTANSSPAFGVKVVSIFHGNPALGKDAHQGLVLLVDPTTGEPQAVLDASAITQIRTAAVSAVATDLLARADADDLAVIGAGTQARAHLRAIAEVRPLRRIRVASRNRSHGEQLAAELQGHLPVPIEVCDDPAAAVSDASIIVTATNAAHPVLTAEMLSPGVHINAVGSSIPTTRELAGSVLRSGRLYADRMDSLINESGDFLMAVAEGAITAEQVVGELGDVVLGRIAGRETPEQVTIFKSLGLAVEDVAAARHVYQAWSAAQAGSAAPAGSAAQAGGGDHGPG